MSRRQQPQGTQVSLFPFLTVLLCAMGALIFLFLVITQQIRNTSLAAQQQPSAVVEPESEPEPEVEAEVPAIPEPVIVVEPEPEPEPEPVVAEPEPVEPPEPIDLNVPWRERLAELKAKWQQKQQQTAQLDKQAEQIQQRLATYEQTARKTVEDENELKARLQKTQSQAEKLKAETDRLNSARIDLEKQIERKKSEVRTAQSEFAIIPYDGQLGTIRRPILIECQEDAITFHPENVPLTAKDLRGFAPYDNPLAAGAQALIEYWEEQDKAAGKEITEPYLLLIVRPSGSVSFYAAQKMLAALEVQTGYELLPESYPIKWPEEDPEATRRCKAAVQAALLQQPTHQEARMAELNSGNQPVTLDEFRQKQIASGGTGGPDSAPSGRPAQSGRQMRFDPNTGRFVEMTPAPQRTNSAWENVDEPVGDRDRRGRDSQRPTGTAREDVPEFSGESELARRRPQQDTQNSPGFASTSSRNNGNQQPSEFAELDRAGNGNDASNPFREGGGQMKSIREINPLEDDLRSGNGPEVDDDKPLNSTFGDTSLSGSGGLQKEFASSSSSLGQEQPWYGGSQSNQSGASAAQGGSSSSFGSPQSGKGGEPSSQFQMPKRMAMHQKLQVIVDGETIRIQGAKPIDVDINRDDDEIADEFKEKISEIVSTWSTLPSGFYWSPYLQFVVLPGGNVSLERLLLQLPTRDMHYETEFELERPMPFQLDKPLIDESVDKILLLEGEPEFQTTLPARKTR
ncbi:MAG: hypothetical protein CMJ46_12360 [Planctomyces sp.]|nr:hypothetical protein [Planctomyces sp.]